MEVMTLKHQAKLIIKDSENLCLESILTFYDSYLDSKNYWFKYLEQQVVLGEAFLLLTNFSIRLTIQAQP